MASNLEFVYGNKELLNSRRRETVADHSPIKAREERKYKGKQPTTYAKTYGFSYRTNRDKHQSVGKLYMGD